MLLKVSSLAPNSLSMMLLNTLNNLAEIDGNQLKIKISTFSVSKFKFLLSSLRNTLSLMILKLNEISRNFIDITMMAKSLQFKLTLKKLQTNFHYRNLQRRLFQFQLMFLPKLHERSRISLRKKRNRKQSKQEQIHNLK